jgi:NAD(P)-dependent dehydrogenase (short-subunit alcohol dehydrogenase family)
MQTTGMLLSQISAVVTGSTKGIGLAIAQELLELNADSVMITARSASEVPLPNEGYDLNAVTRCTLAVIITPGGRTRRDVAGAVRRRACARMRV